MKQIFLTPLRVQSTFLGVELNYIGLEESETKGLEVGWQPTDKQNEFLASGEDIVLYGGAAGGGKSDSLLIDALGLSQNAIAWHKYRAIIFRKTYPEVSELIDRSQEMYPAIFPGAKFHVADKEWHFKSGAKVIFGYMERDEHRFKYQGKEYQYVGWDELTHWANPVCFNFMLSRTRSTNKDIKCYTRATTNPGGRGHGWVKSLFKIPNDGRGTRFVQTVKVKEKEVNRSMRFVPAKLTDNPHLSSTDYGERLLMLPHNERLKLLDGRWDVQEGQYFTDFDPKKHIVKPFQIPLHWPRWRAMDWGYMRPYSIGWYTMDPDGIIYRYRELYGYGGEANVGTREDALEVREKIMRLERSEIRAGVEFRNNPADPSIWTKIGTGRSIAEMFGRDVSWNSPFMHKGTDGQNLKYRVNGWHECSHRLKTGTFKLFEGENEHWIRTVPELLCDETKSEDIDTQMEDHVGDEWRYSMVSRHRYRPQVIEKQDKGLKPFTWDWITYSEEEKVSDYRLNP